MKKIVLWGLCILFIPVVNAQEQVLEQTTVRRAGPYAVRQQYSGILPYIIFQGKRSVTVYPQADFDSPFDQIVWTEKTFSAVRRSQEIAYYYLVSGWNAWRAAANAYLPKKYRLPQLSFTLADDMSLGGVTGDEKNSIFLYLSVHFPSTHINRAGRYSPLGNQIELVLPMHLLTYLSFTDTDPFRRALMEGEYRNMICNVSAGPNDYWDQLTLQGTSLEAVRWHNRYRPLAEKEEKCLDELAVLPAKDWVYKGPFALNNQHTMTHEWGHFFGFGHIDNSIMATGQLRDFGLVTPLKEDGLRLATLVCYHHNEQAGKEVCIPREQPAKPKKPQMASK